MSSKIGNREKPRVFFVDAAVTSLDAGKTLPAKFRRMLKGLHLGEQVRDRKVGIKMHFGSNLGYTTIHPLFVRILVEELQSMGAAEITAMDNKVEDGIIRGYIPEIIGCRTASTFGEAGDYLYREEIGFKVLDFAEFGGEAVDCDFFIDFSHVKGHGSCGFGGAMKNIGMGVVPQTTRSKIHQLEGGISHDPEICELCLKCVEACPNGAIKFDGDDNRAVFYHNCTFCQHCVLACEQGALEIEDRKFSDFARGMALVTEHFLGKFKPEDMLFINFLTNITMYCDCWGMSTPSLTPDIGVMASRDIVAIDIASLDMIKTENLIPNGLPKDRELLEGNGHLFERIHGKDPYLMLRTLAELLDRNGEYHLEQLE